MFNFIKKYLAEGSIVFFIGTIVSSFFHYLFNFQMGKMLTPDEFGTFSALIAIILIIGVPLNTLQMVVTKYAAEFYAKGKISAIKSLIIKTGKHTVTFGIIIALLFIILSGFLKELFNVDSVVPFFALAVFPIPFTILPLLRGAIQGLHKFFALGINMIIEGPSRFLCGTLLVLIGFGVNGAILASPFSAIIALIFCIFPARIIFKEKTYDTLELSTAKIYKYAIPTLLTQLCIATITFMDLIAVKRYFYGDLVGHYASAEVLGRVVFFFPAPITLLMFPKVAYLKAKGESVRRILIKSLLIVISLCVPLAISYKFFPYFIVVNIFNEKYIPGIPFLAYFGVAMGFFAITNLLCFFQLSIEKFKFIPLLIFMTFVQFFLILMFHETPYQILYVLIFCGGVLAISNLYLSFKCA